jgi:opacity protein-like surface antigen
MKVDFNRFKTIALIAGIILITSPIEAQKFPWSFSFDAGAASPTSDFNGFVQDGPCLGINVEYMNYPFLGVRVAYDNQKFDAENRYQASDKIEVDQLAVSAVIAHSFPKWIRVFALIGPCYYSVRNQVQIGFSSDGEDIGWNSGAGFEFYPVPNWGVRFQALYCSAQLNNDEVRMSWLDTTVGLSFRF